LDSLGGSALRVSLAQAVGMQLLAASVIFDYPSVQALVGYLETHLDSNEGGFEPTSHLFERPIFAGSLEQQKTALRSFVMDTVTETLGHSVGFDDPLVEAGLDSLGGSALRVSLAQAVGMQLLAASVIFDYPSVQALVGYLETCLEPSGTYTLTVQEPVLTVLRSFPGTASIEPGHQSGDCYTPDSLALTFAAMEDALRSTLGGELGLEHSFLSSHDHMPLVELGVSDEMLAMVQAKLPVDIDMSTKDSLQAILERQKRAFTYRSPDSSR